MDFHTQQKKRPPMKLLTTGILLSLKAVLLSALLVAAPIYAADYTTTLTLTPASSPIARQLVFHWSTDKLSGSVGPTDLTSLSMQILSDSGQIYYDQIVSQGVIRPLPGAARVASDITWDFNIDTMTLWQLRNVGDAAVVSASGIRYQIQDNAALPVDSVVAISAFGSGAIPSASGILLSQSSTRDEMYANSVTYKRPAYEQGNFHGSYYGGQDDESSPVVLSAAQADQAVLGAPDGSFLSLPGLGPNGDSARITVGFPELFEAGDQLVVTEIGASGETAYLFVGAGEPGASLGNAQLSITRGANEDIIRTLHGSSFPSLYNVNIHGTSLGGNSQGFDLDSMAIISQYPGPDPVLPDNVAVQPSCCVTLAFIAALTHGWQFVPDEDMTITSLGWSDPEQDGMAHTHDVGLFHVNTAQPIVRTEIDGGNRLLNGYRYVDITPVQLTAGETYIIGGFDPGGPSGGDRYSLAPLAETSISEAIEVLGYVSASGAAGLAKPTSAPSPAPAGQARWPVNFEFNDSQARITGNWQGGKLSDPHGLGTTSVLSDGSNGTAIFTYDNNHVTTGGDSGAWTFTTVASADGNVALDWMWSGFHAYHNVYANLHIRVLREGVPISDEFAVDAHTLNCCASPSNGFNYEGTSNLTVQAGDQIVFTLGGSNYDTNSALEGTLTIELGTFNPGPVLDNPIADQLDLLEDDPSRQIDVSQTFSAPGAISLSISNSAPGVVSATLVNEIITLTPVANQSGDAVITVTATSGGVQVADEFDVSIAAVMMRRYWSTPLVREV